MWQGKRTQENVNRHKIEPKSYKYRIRHRVKCSTMRTGHRTLEGNNNNNNNTEKISK